MKSWNWQILGWSRVESTRASRRNRAFRMGSSRLILADDLEGHPAAELLVEPDEDRAHPPLPDLADDAEVPHAALAMKPSRAAAVIGQYSTPSSALGKICRSNLGVHRRTSTAFVAFVHASVAFVHSISTLADPYVRGTRWDARWTCPRHHPPSTWFEDSLLHASSRLIMANRPRSTKPRPSFSPAQTTHEVSSRGQRGAVDRSPGRERHQTPMGKRTQGRQSLHRDRSPLSKPSAKRGWPISSAPMSGVSSRSCASNVGVREPGARVVPASTADPIPGRRGGDLRSATSANRLSGANSDWSTGFRFRPGPRSGR
jgi:hypothetical protein